MTPTRPLQSVPNEMRRCYPSPIHQLMIFVHRNGALLKIINDLSNDNDQKYGKLKVKVDKKEYMIYDEVDMNRKYSLAVCVYLQSSSSKYKISLDCD